MSTPSQCNRYGVLVSELGRRALRIAARIAPLPSANPPVALGLPAAAVLLGTDAAASIEAGAAVLARRATRYDDAMGFTRSVYHPLLVRLHLLAGAKLADAAVEPMDQTAEAGAIDLELWRCAALSAAGRHVARRVDRALAQDGTALHPRGPQDLLDAWTYRELAALAALHDLATEQNEPRWRRRVEHAAAHHQRVTQPDYTTYQPWGVSAFAATTDCQPFADQQLHDAQTNLHVDGRCAAVVAMILADAAWTLRRIESS